jgi:hypothetical protein
MESACETNGEGSKGRIAVAADGKKWKIDGCHKEAPIYRQRIHCAFLTGSKFVL